MVRGIVTTEGRSDVVTGEVVTANYFEVLGVRPVLGRGFHSEEDATEGTHPVMVLSHGLWQRRLGGDPDVVGKSLRLSGVDYNIIGVAPETYTGTIPGIRPEYWVPTAMVENLTFNGIQSNSFDEPDKTRRERRGTRWLFVKGRLAPGASVEEAQAQVSTVFARLTQEYPDTNEDMKAAVLGRSSVRFHPMVDNILATAGAVLLAAVGMILMIACANVANMLLARAANRSREIAVRLSVGASRGRLVRQLMTESLVLATLGGVMGVALAYWAARVLSAAQPPLPIPIKFAYELDTSVMAFAFLVSLATAVFFGLVPAFRASRPNLVRALKGEGIGIDDPTKRRFTLSNALVVGQLAVSLVLLVAGALLTRGLVEAQRTEVGFDASRIASIGFNLQMNNQTDDDVVPIDVVYVGEDYFRVTGIPIVYGRAFSEQDREGAPAVVIVNETMAERYWSEKSAVGELLYTGGPDGDPVEIVGVSRDHKVRTLGEEPRPYLHFARAQSPRRSTQILARTSGPAEAHLPALRDAILEVEPEIVFTEDSSASDIVEITLVPTRLGARLLGAFGGLALLLAAVGLYGVIAYAVSRRTHEVGLRMALGADASDVLAMILRQGMTLAVVGVVFGAVFAAVLARVLQALLYGVSSFDPLAYGLAALLLLAVAFAANLIPAWRASRVSPMAALRYE